MKNRTLLIFILLLLSPAGVFIPGVFAQTGLNTGSLPDLNAGDGGREQVTSPEIENLLARYNEKPTPRAAAELGEAYHIAGDLVSAVDYYLKAAETWRRPKDRARAYYNAATSVIEANLAAMKAPAPAGGDGGSGVTGIAGKGGLEGVPPVDSAIDYLHRSLDLDPGREAAAYNMEIAKMIRAAQKDRQEQEEQNGDGGEESREKQDSGQDSQSGSQEKSGESGQESDGEQPGEQMNGENSPEGDSEDRQNPREGNEEEPQAATGNPSEEISEDEAASSGTEEGSEEEDIQEKLSEILGSEEENRQLREAMLEKSGGIGDVERDW